MKSKKMGLELVWTILAIVVGAYIFVFGFVKKINEWYYVKGLGKKQNSLPPGELGWPFLGNTLSFLRAFKSQDPDYFINNLVKRYGRTGIYKTHLSGKPSIIVCSGELCKKVLTDNERFIVGYDSNMMKLLGRKSIVSSSNSEHKRIRRLITAPINGHEALSMYIGFIEDIVISSLEEWANMNSPIEFLSALKKITFNVINKIYMGSTNFISDSIEKYYTDMFQGLSALDINIPGFPFHRALKARKKLVSFFQAHLDEKKARKIDEPNTKSGMIDLLLEAKDENGEKMDDEQIIDLLIGFLLGGRDTTAHAAMWLTIYLHDHPEVLQKAREEQMAITKRRSSSQRGLTLNEIRHMQYLSKAIDETLRRSGIVLATSRKAKVDVKINDYIIPKGWKVIIWNRGIHLDSEGFPNPEDFLPSRWDNHTPKAGSFIPFGAGSRICPGADLAKLEMSIFFHYFLLNYRFERSNPGNPIRYLTCPSPKDNCLGKIIKLP